MEYNSPFSNLTKGMGNLAEYIKTARPFIANIASRAGQAGFGAGAAGLGPLGAGATAASTLYPYVKDSNFPDIKRRPNSIAQAARGFGAGAGMTPQDKINESFGALPQQAPLNADLQQRFAAQAMGGPMVGYQKPTAAPPPPAAPAAPQGEGPTGPMPFKGPAEISPQPGPQGSMLENFFSKIYDMGSHPPFGGAPSGPRVGPFGM